jgi:hypothetical protein
MCMGVWSVWSLLWLLEDQCVDHVVICKVPEWMGLEYLAILIDASTVCKANAGGGIQLFSCQWRSLLHVTLGFALSSMLS